MYVDYKGHIFEIPANHYDNYKLGLNYGIIVQSGKEKLIVNLQDLGFQNDYFKLYMMWLDLYFKMMKCERL